MKNKSGLIFGAIVLLLIITGVVVSSVLSKPQVKSPPQEPIESSIDETLPKNTTIAVSVQKSVKDPNTVVITVNKLEKKYTGIAYEVTYQTQGTFQGVNSGSKPIDVTSEDTFTRDVYLGTCSKNVCKPHTGVTSISLALELTDSDGNKSQYTEDVSL